MRWSIFICLFFSISSYGQYQSFILGIKGDTLNRVSMDSLREGRWVIKMPPLRGEPGYTDQGVYIHGKKDGTWRRFSEVGDLLAEENYKFGYKHGQSVYYNLFGKEREESWKAIDPENPYDTVDVPDLHTDVVYRRVVKIDATTVRHGTWTFYNPQTGLITKTEEYVFDQLTNGKKPSFAAGKGPVKYVRDSTKTLAKPREVMDYEKKNSNKKKVKVREGGTGVP